ncbi:MAG TPA: ABC transporter permease [Pyrinomonadaceae bacterium]|jgi:putative ABC transport system permease protein
MTTLWQDLRYGVRVLRQSRGFTAVAVVSLALGIGANTAVFSVVNAVLLRALPYAEPARLVLLWSTERASGDDRGQVSATDVADFAARNHVFAAVSTYGDWQGFISGDGGLPERLVAAQVGEGFFEVLRGRALLGRTFLPEEQQDGKDFVVVLSYGLWQRRFGGDPSVVGRTIQLGGRPYTVVGVMPADFQSLPKGLLNAPAELYRPVAEPPDETQRGARHLRAIARLRDGVTVEQAQAEMRLIAAQLEAEHPRANANYGVRVTPLGEDLTGPLRPALLMLLGAVGFVLLIACANVGNLLLARSAARQKELAIRAALGAGRWRIVRQLMTESVLLALAGGALGLLGALWGTSLIEAAGAQLVPWLGAVEIDGRVLGFTCALSLVTGLIFGLAPAWRMSRPELNETLKEGGRGAGAGSVRSRLRSGLVVAEVALALVLLICAGLLIKSVARLYNVNPGFEAARVLTMNVWLPRAQRPQPRDWHAAYARIIERLEAVPGVEAAALVSTLPADGFDRRTVELEGQAYQPGEYPDVDNYVVTPDYLRAMSIPVLRGRAFAAADTADAPPVALVSETMARRLWPGADPLGRRLRYYSSAGPAQAWVTVVGVVGDVRQYGLDKPGTMGLYRPDAQLPSFAGTLVVRTTQAPASLAAQVRREIAATDKDVAVYGLQPMTTLLAETILLRRFAVLLLGAFAALALVLAVVGLYGVMAYTVTQRTHEIGVRLALGAQARDVFRLVIGHGMLLTLAGTGLGLLASLALTRVLRTLLYEVSTTDPLTYAGLTALLAAVALVACYVPARRATKVDPMTALRYE